MMETQPVFPEMTVELLKSKGIDTDDYFGLFYKTIDNKKIIIDFAIDTECNESRMWMAFECFSCIEMCLSNLGRLPLIGEGFYAVTDDYTQYKVKKVIHEINIGEDLKLGYALRYIIK